MIALIGAMIALVTLSGCIEIESVISLKKDGSGTLTETLNMGAQAAAMMKVRSAEGAGGLLARFDEKSLKERVKTMGEGVELVGVEIIEGTDGSLSLVTTYKFSDISNLIYDPKSVLEKDEIPMSEKEKMFSFKDGELTIAIPNPNEDSFALGNQGLAEEELAMMAPMLTGTKGTVKIVSEGGIESTNATFHEGNTITLVSMDFDEIMKNEEGLKALTQLQGETREEFAQAVARVKGMDVETKAEVKIKLK